MYKISYKKTAATASEAKNPFKNAFLYPRTKRTLEKECKSQNTRSALAHSNKKKENEKKRKRNKIT